MPRAMRVAGVEPAVLEWLLEPRDPAVRLATLTGLVGRSARHREVREARAAVMESGFVPALLAKQAPEGCWGAPDAFYTAKYGGTVWQVIALAEHHADGRDPRVRRSCEFLLAHSRDPASGGFSKQRAKRAGGGQPSGVIPCLTGNLVWSLLRLGYGGDPRVEHGIDWLTRNLRFDDGDTEPPEDFPYRRCEICYGRHSCFMGVVKALKAFAEIGEARRSEAVRRTVKSAAEFMLKHRVYKRSSDPSRVAKPAWTRFGFPRMYQTDALEVTAVLLALGFRDPRLEDAIALIAARRQPDGRWLLQDTLNGKMPLDVEKKGAPSKWVSLNALRVLRCWAAPS